MKKQLLTYACLLLLVVVTAFAVAPKKPVLYIIGDSTVRNGDGTGSNNQWGWGSFVHLHFDTTKIEIQNHAIGGRSSRTFQTEGRWERIMATLQQGDYVLMQFGHNDAGPIDDTARARGVLRGIGAESKEIWNPITKKNEVVYTFGHYLRKFVADAKSKGAHPIVCAQIPRNRWQNGRIERSDSTWSLWAEQVAKAEGVPFIDLNDLVAERYEDIGSDNVLKLFAPDLTHTLREGAMMNAQILADAIRQQKPSGLHQFLKSR
ncbi:rhamnogalacturonan acetylesterase [Pseudocnuella soli]|uniref:rhamnogalacturonan acetylesterase n=1 Tax=Pseudocnuella soli TaxID=2502779 RepID=UPI0010431910|nr:rhamnogalacturonan acetylesterase [Pseudocnuella soli]